MLTMLVEVFNFFIDSVIFCGHIGILIGYGIVFIITSAVLWAFAILTSAFSIIQVLLEDFCAFLREASDLSEGIATGVSDAVEGIGDTYVNEFVSVFDWIIRTVRAVLVKQIAFCRSVVDLSCYLLKLIVDGLSLIGSLSLNLVQLLFVLLYNIITAPITSFLYVCTSIYSAIIVGIDTVVNLPFESAIGLFVVLLAAALYRKYNGTRKVKYLVKLSFVGMFRAIQLFITACILIKWSITRFLRRIKLPSFSLRKPRSSRKQEESPSKIELIKKLEQEMSLRMCVICMANPRDVIVMNCQHFCMCNSCAKQIRNMSNECPVCRKHIFRISYVYM